MYPVTETLSRCLLPLHLNVFNNNNNIASTYTSTPHTLARAACTYILF